MAFWLVFAGEHLINDDDTLGRYHGLLGYWKNLSVVMFGCLCLFIFDLCERGVQLKVSFFSLVTLFKDLIKYSLKLYDAEFPLKAHSINAWTR